MSELTTGLVAGIIVTTLSGGLFWILGHYRLLSDRNTRLLANQYQIMMLSGASQTLVELSDSPALALSRREFRQIEAIEAELIHESDAEMAIRVLKSFSHGNDPWVVARAAWALTRWDPESALTDLKKLLHDRSPYVQLPAVWALGQWGTPVAVSLLIENVHSGHADIQRAVLRSLVQISNQKKLPLETSSQIQSLFKDIRAKTGWVL